MRWQQSQAESRLAVCSGAGFEWRRAVLVVLDWADTEAYLISRDGSKITLAELDLTVPSVVAYICHYCMERLD